MTTERYTCKDTTMLILARRDGEELVLTRYGSTMRIEGTDIKDSQI